MWFKDHGISDKRNKNTDDLTDVKSSPAARTSFGKLRKSKRLYEVLIVQISCEILSSTLLTSTFF